MPIMELTEEEILEIIGPARESVIGDDVREAVANLRKPEKGKQVGIKFGPIPRKRSETARNILYHVLKNTPWYRPKKGKIPGNATVRSLSPKDAEEQYFAVIRSEDPEEPK